VPTFRLQDLSLWFYRSDHALKNAKLVLLLINCDRFSCRHLCGL